MTQTVPQISLIAAFSAGLLSFVSPCVLPLVPSYISYITGLSLEQLADAAERHRFRRAIVVNSLLFIGGVLIVIFGLYLLGVLNLNFLQTEKRLHFRSRPAGYLGSFLIGVAFAAGWTPCVGPVLGTILLYASTTDSLMSGVTLLTSYSLGLGLPLFATALGVDSFLAYFKQFRVYLWGVSTVSGVLLVVVGVMIYANTLTIITSFLERYGIGWYVGQ